ncbi:hypothetical protein [Vibrio chagasii]
MDDLRSQLGIGSVRRRRPAGVGM